MTAPEPVRVGCVPPTTGQTLAKPEPVDAGQDPPDARQHNVSLQLLSSFWQREGWKRAQWQWQGSEQPRVTQTGCTGRQTRAPQVTPVLSWQPVLGTSTHGHYQVPAVQEGTRFPAACHSRVCTLSHSTSLCPSANAKSVGRITWGASSVQL